jgi:aspartate kinase
VALAAALGAERCELVKATGGLRTADPLVVPDAALLPAATHRFLADLATAGARVVSAPAAALALAERVPLRLRGLGPGQGTSIDDSAAGLPLRAIAAGTTDDAAADEAIVTVVNHGDDDPCATGRQLRAVAERAARIRGVAHDAERVGFRVARADAAPLVRTLHDALAAFTFEGRIATA